MNQRDLNPGPGGDDHVGLALWAAAEAWRRQLTVAMAVRGVDWFGEARAALIPHIRAEGARMADLPARSGLSRQAVHQFIQALETDGVVVREADPNDARGRIVRFTDKGLAILRESDVAKREIEGAYACALGQGTFASFLVALKVLASFDGGGKRKGDVSLQSPKKPSRVRGHT